MVAVVGLAAVAGAVLGLFSLDAKAWLYGPLERSSRYSGVGGAFRGLVEGLFAMGAGALVVSRGVWLLVGLITRMGWSRKVVGAQLGVGDVMLLPILAVWLYLVWASW